MRKKGALLLAALMVVLSSCAGVPGAETSVTPSGEASETAADMGDTSANATESGGVLLPDGLLPQTEYIPPSLPPRFYEDVTLALIPRGDYGRIWPYIGGHLTQMWMQGELYGLCDEQGRVICDPAYNEVQIIEKDGLRLYKLTKYARDTDYRDISKITLAKLDGSWAEEYDDVETLCYGTEFASDRALQWRENVTYEYITVCRNGKWGVIDYDGSEILPLVYNAPVCFSEGLASVLSGDGTTFSFINDTGAVVLGPFGTPPAQVDFFETSDDPSYPLNHGLIFCDGRVRFYEDGKYGVVDRDGNIVVPPQYAFISSYSDGTAEFLTDGTPDAPGLAGVIGLGGKILFGPTDTWFSKGTGATAILSEQDSQISVNLLTGERTPWAGSETPSFMSSSEDGVTVEWAGNTLHFPEAMTVTMLDNGNFALSLRGEPETWKIADRSGDTVAGPFDGRIKYSRDGFIVVELGEPYDPSTWAFWTALYDETGQRVLPGTYLSIVLFDGRYLARTDTYGGLLDENGNWVVKAPLYDYLND